jgi:hypothetical protein
MSHLSHSQERNIDKDQRSNNLTEQNKRWEKKSDHDVTSPLENRGFPRYHSEHTMAPSRRILRENPKSAEPQPLDKEIRVMKWLKDCEDKGAHLSALPAHLPDIKLCDKVGLA